MGASRVTETFPNTPDRIRAPPRVARRPEQGPRLPRSDRPLRRRAGPLPAHESGHIGFSVVNPAQHQSLRRHEPLAHQDGQGRRHPHRPLLRKSIKPARLEHRPRPTPATLQALVRRLESLGEMRRREQNRLDVSTRPRPRLRRGGACSCWDQQIEADPAGPSSDHIGTQPRAEGSSAICWSEHPRRRRRHGGGSCWPSFVDVSSVRRGASGGRLRRPGPPHPPVRLVGAGATPRLSKVGSSPPAPRPLLPGDGGASLQPVRPGARASG